jgi:hypothetical protein
MGAGLGAAFAAGAAFGEEPKKLNGSGFFAAGVGVGNGLGAAFGAVDWEPKISARLRVGRGASGFFTEAALGAGTTLATTGAGLGAGTAFGAAFAGVD